MGQRRFVREFTITITTTNFGSNMCTCGMKMSSNNNKNNSMITNRNSNNNKYILPNRFNNTTCEHSDVFMEVNVHIDKYMCMYMLLGVCCSLPFVFATLTTAALATAAE